MSKIMNAKESNCLQQYMLQTEGTNACIKIQGAMSELYRVRFFSFFLPKQEVDWNNTADQLKSSCPPRDTKGHVNSKRQVVSWDNHILNYSEG